MSITDCITLFLSIFLLVRGASRGFIKSLIGPFSTITATILSIVYYQYTKEIFISLIIGLCGPLLLYFLLKSLVKTWALASDSDIKPNFFSRLSGALLTLLWGWTFIIFILIFFSLLPSMGNALTMVHRDVIHSQSYYAARPFENIFFAVPHKNTVTVKKNHQHTDAETLAQDPRFQQVLQDPEIQKEIDAHDFIKLMGNPKMMKLTTEIMNDPAALKKVMAVYGSQSQTGHSN